MELDSLDSKVLIEFRFIANKGIFLELDMASMQKKVYKTSSI